MKRLWRLCRVLVWVSAVVGSSAALRAASAGAAVSDEGVVSGGSAFTGGAVVEQVAPGSALATAGVRAGEVVVAWRRGALGGPVESVFDLRAVQVEQAPRGPVTLTLLDGPAHRRVTVDHGSWDGRFRPVLPPDDVARLLAGEELVAAGRVEEGVARWEEARGAPAASGTGATATWWGLRIAEAWTAAGRAAEATAAGDRTLAGTTTPLERVAVLEGLGTACQRAGELERARALLEEALALRERTWGEGLELARGLHQLGNLAWAQGRLDEADGLYRRSLELRQRLAPGSLEVASSHNNLGVMAYYRGELDAPAEHYAAALEIRRRLAPESFDVAVLLNNLGLVHYARGDLETAESYYRRVLGVWEDPSPEHRELLASVLDNLGNVALDRGDLEAAEARHREALAIWEEVAPRGRAIAECLDNLGLVLRARGELALAGDFLERALALRRELGNATFVASSLANLGSLARTRGELALAAAYLEQALVGEALPAGSVARANLLGDLAGLSLERGLPGRARELLESALAIVEERAPESLHAARLLTDLARVAREDGDPDEALRLLERALDLGERLVPDGREHAATLALRASLAHELGEPAVGAWYERALAAVETHLDRTGGSHHARAELRARWSELHRGHLELLLEQGRPERAFAALERSRARAFLALLAERDLTVGSGVPVELETERRRLAVLYDRTHASADTAEGVAADGLARELRRLQAEHEALLARIRRASPRYAALRYPEPLDAAAVAAALDAGTVLLAWSLGEETSRLFVLPAGGAVRVHTLPVGARSLGEEVARFRTLVEGARVGSPRLPTLAAAGAALYDRLLAPAEAAIENAERLLLLPEGPLHLLPWAALRRPASLGSEVATFLGTTKPFALVLSATAFVELRSDAAPAPRPRSSRVAVFGDPLYPSPPPDPAGARAGGTSDRRCALTPLPETRDEAATIAALWDGDAVLHLGAEATESRVTAAAQDAAILHVAAHGCLDERHPLASGIALSRSGTAGDDRDNGLLQAWEVFAGPRIAADLVVLSACDSAAGPEVAGEGLLGLARAFHTAGARSVVASLWQIPDRATAELMVLFHRNLRAGRDRDVALAAAAAELAADPRGLPPYHWAGFQLYGDWRGPAAPADPTRSR